MRFFLTLTTFFSFCSSCIANTNNSIGPVESLIENSISYSFEPPKGWKKDVEALSEQVLVIYLGEAKNGLTPSINLTWEPSELSSKDYVKIAKKAQLEVPETHCHEAGTLTCKAGTLHLLQVDRQTEWGKLRFIQGMLVKEGRAFVITATAAPDEFPSFVSDFFNAFKSFNVQ